MTNIKNIAKYNLGYGGFINSNLDNKGLSIVVDKVIYDDNDPSYDYIILINGNRAMDVTKDGVHPFGVRDYVKRMCDHLKSKNRNYVVEHILLDNDAPLMEEARVVARHVDLLAQMMDVNTINLIGHSKGGTIMFNVPKFLKSDLSFEKTSITTTATPFKGCLLASPKIFLEHVKRVVYAQLPPHIAKYTYEALVSYYKNMHSGSHMDNDIALIGYESDYYDPNFIAGMFDPININAMQQMRFFQNYVTWIDDYTIIDSLRRGDFTSVGMCLLDKFFMSEVTDGFVETKSQQSVSRHIEVKTNNLKSRTHYFLTHDEDLAAILDSIDEKILEFGELKKTPRF